MGFFQQILQLARQSPNASLARFAGYFVKKMGYGKNPYPSSILTVYLLARP